MQALRQRAARVAQRARSTSAAASLRTYASSHGHEEHGDHGHKEQHHEGDHGHDGHDHHHHHESHKVEEKLGPAFYIFAGALPTAYLGYSFTRPGTNGEPSSVTQWLQGFERLNKEEWNTRNHLRTQALDQAAQDKHLFLYAGKNTHIELKTPELFYSGSPINVPAGHSINLDHITEHYKTQHLEAEEKKAKKLAEKAAAAAAAAAAQEKS